MVVAIAAFATLTVDCHTIEDAAREVKFLSTDHAAAAPMLASRKGFAAELAEKVVVKTSLVELDRADGSSASSKQASAPEPEAEPQLLFSIARETWVMDQPKWKSRRLGYLRAGASVKRSDEPAGFHGCTHGWYEVQPKGFACVGSTATLDEKHPVVQLSARAPKLDGLPYLYAMSRFPTPPMYARLPNVAQQKRAEPARHYYLRKHQRLTRSADFVQPPPAHTIPPLLRNGAVVPALGNVKRGASRVVLGRARIRSGFALLATYDVEGRRFGMTTELALLPLDRMRLVKPSTFQGVVLSDEFTLPIAIVRSRHARRYRLHPPGRALALDGLLAWREVIALTGRMRRFQRQDYFEARDGSFMRTDQVVRINRFTRAPGWAKKGKKWLDVSLLRQALVAYEGKRPIFATLVSTGADGLANHKESHATIQGTFLIHTKHVSVTMDNDEGGDVFDLRDVPFVQYFTEGYAFHGAYWHDDFGNPRSHGCVNLAPRDAAWLFRWTDPPVPSGWHAALSLKQGTVVHIHP